MRRTFSFPRQITGKAGRSVSTVFSALCNKLSCMLRLMSMLITLIPMLAQIGCLVFDKADHYEAAFLVPLFLWIGEYVFEFISLLGSAVCLDKRWSHMAEKMMGGFLFFLIPLVLSLLMHLLHKRTRRLQAGA